MIVLSLYVQVHWLNKFLLYDRLSVSPARIEFHVTS